MSYYYCADSISSCIVVSIFLSRFYFVLTLHRAIIQKVEKSRLLTQSRP